MDNIDNIMDDILGEEGAPAQAVPIWVQNQDWEGEEEEWEQPPPEPEPDYGYWMPAQVQLCQFVDEDLHICNMPIAAGNEEYCMDCLQEVGDECHDRLVGCDARIFQLVDRINELRVERADMRYWRNQYRLRRLVNEPTIDLTQPDFIDLTV